MRLGGMETILYFRKVSSGRQQALLAPFYDWEKWGPEPLRDYLRISQTIKTGDKSETRLIQLQTISSLYYTYYLPCTVDRNWLPQIVIIYRSRMIRWLTEWMSDKTFIGEKAKRRPPKLAKESLILFLSGSTQPAEVLSFLMTPQGWEADLGQPEPKYLGVLVHVFWINGHIFQNFVSWHLRS